MTKLPETLAAAGTFGGNGVESVVGHPMGAQVGYVYDGIFKSQDEIANHAAQNGGEFSADEDAVHSSGRLCNHLPLAVP